MFITYGLDTNDTPDRIADYVSNGAEEFFAGFVPREWLEKYGWEVCPNRRSLGGGYNYTQVSELQATAAEIHRRGCRLNLAINAQDNGLERLDDLRRTVETMESFNPDGYIIADPALMCSLKRWGIDKPVHLSTGAGCFSSAAVRFYCEHFNVRRVVIPRKMTLNEMRRMIESLADLHVEFEVMIIGYRCFFNDEDCHSVHSGCHRNLCGDVLASQFIATNRFPDNWKQATEDILSSKMDAFRCHSLVNDFCLKWQRHEPPDPVFKTPLKSSSGLSSCLASSVFQNCGLCAIRELRDMGVHALKVPLRGSRDFKLPALQVVNAVMRNPDPTPEFCRALIGSPDFCDQRHNCYYDVPEAHR